MFERPARPRTVVCATKHKPPIPGASVVTVLSVGIRAVAVIPVAVIPVAVIPVAVAPVAVPAAKLWDDLVRSYVCGKNARGGAESGELPPDVVLQQHIRVRPPGCTTAADDQLAVTGRARPPLARARAPTPGRAERDDHSPSLPSE